MAIALNLARLGVGRTSPNPSVGAVIVKDGRIVATGFHKGPGTAHAEVEALNLVCRGGVTPPLHGATLYVTLEPCCPPKIGGRTPPCTDAIIKSGIKTVVIGLRDPDPNVSGKGIRILRKNGIRVREGVLRRECEELNRAYLKHRKTGIPFVTLKMALSRDNRVGRGRGRPVWVTGPEARRHSHLMRDQVDAILVGVKTIITDNPRLTTRSKGGHDPIRVVLDSRLKIPPASKILHLRSKVPTWIATTLPTSHPRRRRLARKGVEILACRSSKGRVDLKDLLRRLGERGVVSLLVEGGPTVWRAFLGQRLVDRVMIYRGNRSLGARGLPVRPPKPFKATCRAIEADLLIEGKI